MRDFNGNSTKSKFPKNQAWSFTVEDISGNSFSFSWRATKIMGGVASNVYDILNLHFYIKDDNDFTDYTKISA